MALAKGILSKVHIARQQLGMDDESYRSLLGRVAGVRSAKDLTGKQAAAVLREFERLGWKPKPSQKAAGRPHNFATMPEQIRKIEAQLADMSLSWSYADAIARQMFKVQRVAWLRKSEQLDAILTALHVEQEKRLGVSGPERVASLEQLPKGWERQRPILKALVDTLHAALDEREGV
jgi:phage gp16-like protein